MITLWIICSISVDDQTHMKGWIWWEELEDQPGTFDGWTENAKNSIVGSRQKCSNVVCLPLFLECWFYGRIFHSNLPHYFLNFRGKTWRKKIFANVTRGRQMTDILSTKCIILLPLKIPYKGMLPLLIILTPMISFLFSLLLLQERCVMTHVLWFWNILEFLN